MNRVLFGNTGAYTGPSIHGPDAGEGNPDYFNRQNETGMFISKPGHDVLTCNSADLLFSTDSASNGFIMVLERGSVNLPPATYTDSWQNTVSVHTGIIAPHPDKDPTTLMVNWFPIAGMGRYHGSNIYDCMGGNGQNSWDGSGKDDRGLPNGFNALYTGNDEDTFDNTGMIRKHFWQIPDVGVNNYHLSNTVITNDPSAFFWSWFQQPQATFSIDPMADWGFTGFLDGTGQSGQFLNPGTGGNVRDPVQFSGGDSLMSAELRDLGGKLKTQGDFLYCESYTNTFGEFILKFYNNHLVNNFHLSWVVYRERSAL